MKFVLILSKNWVNFELIFELILSNDCIKIELNFN